MTKSILAQHKPQHNPTGLAAQLGAVLRRAAQQPEKTYEAAKIRQRIKFLCRTYGDCLNAWPDQAQAEHKRLARELRRLESSDES